MNRIDKIINEYVMKRTMKENSYKYQCPNCIYTFQTQEDLKMHLLNH